MNQYVTGAVIRMLREKNHLTQVELGDRINVSDKTVSKWETAKGYPDISLLEPLAKALGVSVTELISGKTVSNVNVSANMLRSKFYVCPVCGNVIHSTGEAVINCHGILLTPIEAEETDEDHKIFIERVEDEYYVQMEHDMKKKHYISFFKMDGVKQILFYCNKDGLFSIQVNEAIDGREKSYDDTEEKRALEQAAKMLFG